MSGIYKTMVMVSFDYEPDTPATAMVYPGMHMFSLDGWLLCHGSEAVMAKFKADATSGEMTVLDIKRHTITEGDDDGITWCMRYHETLYVEMWGVYKQPFHCACSEPYRNKHRMYNKQLLIVQAIARGLITRQHLHKRRDCALLFALGMRETFREEDLMNSILRLSVSGISTQSAAAEHPPPWRETTVFGPVRGIL